MTADSVRAVFWDFGGVILTSPFEAFNRYERDNDLPHDFIRGINASNPDTNAWARLERNDITPEQFDEAFADESARRGHRVPGADVLALLSGDVRPDMVVALDRVIDAGLVTACLTNNVVSDAHQTHRRPEVEAVMDRFDHVVESSKVGVRKPEPRFYEIACELAGVPPGNCVFLDDLGINLKPARAMGMRTIKVVGAEQAITDLESVLGLDLR
jgi:putative hydrolase of the HAD superfamily